MYKILTGSLDVPSNDFSPNQCPSREECFNQLQPQTMIDLYKFSFFPSVTRVWNTLPLNVISSPTLDEFSTNLHNHYDHTCVPQSI